MNERDWTVPPGETLREALAEREMTQGELAVRIGRSESVVSRIINGRADITPAIAIQLEGTLGISAGFWANLEAQHRLQLERLRVKGDPATDDEIVLTFTRDEVAVMLLDPGEGLTNEQIALAESVMRKFVAAHADNAREDR